MADVFDQYAMADAWDEMFAAPGRAAPGVPLAVRHAAAALGGRPALPGRPAGPGLHRPRRHVRLRRRGAALPARPHPAHPRRRRVGHADPRGAAAGPGAGARSWPTSTAPGEVLADGVVPRRLVLTSAHFHRAGGRASSRANGVRVHVSGVDLIRDEDGQFRVLEDNLRIPSGVSYVIENRRALSQTLPEPVRRGPGAPGRRLPGPAAGRAAGRRAGGRRPTRAWSCSPRASTTRPTSSTRCWPG